MGKFIEIIKEELESTADVSSFINNVLMNEYPRLYQMLVDFYHKVESTTSNYDQTLPINQQALLTKINGKQHKENLIESINKFKKLFLNKCIDRIKQPLNILFSNTEIKRIPTIADMRTLWTTFYNELKITQDTPILQVNIGNIIYLNGIKQMIIHLKRKIISVTYNNNKQEESQNSNNLSDFRHNIDIYNCIQALYFHIWSLQEKYYSDINNNSNNSNSIKLDKECNLSLTKCCNLLYNFNCYLLYYCLKIFWYTLIPSLSSFKIFSFHIQFISHSILPIINSGIAMDYVLKQWNTCLTMLYLQFISLNYDITNDENIQIIATNIVNLLNF